MAGMSAFGTLLKRGNGATAETFTTIANVTNIGGPNLEVDTIETTSHDSTGGWEEFIAGIKRGGEVELELNYDPSNATHETLLDDFDGRALHNFQLIWPTTPSITWTFAALVAEVGIEAPFDDKLGCSTKLKISGAVTRP